MCGATTGVGAGTTTGKVLGSLFLAATPLPRGAAGVGVGEATGETVGVGVATARAPKTAGWAVTGRGAASTRVSWAGAGAGAERSMR